MTGLDIFALVVLLVLSVTMLTLAIFLARLPGQLAAKRQHSKAEAINIAGWLGLINGISWMVALIWAFTETAPSEVSTSSVEGENQ